MKMGCRYVYQKAYVEFFCSPEKFHALQQRLKSKPTVTYMAVDSSGDVQSNVPHMEANAVTWGVFPGKEIVQPTVVDPASFKIWKVGFCLARFENFKTAHQEAELSL